MGTILASAILSKAAIILQDTANVRWPMSEMLGWLNDGQREVCILRPELSVTLGNITLVAGTKQTLPTAGLALMRVIRNMGVGGSTPGYVLRPVPFEFLDAQVPDWHTQTQVTALKHYVYDSRVPKTFYVYPPSVVNNQIEAVYSVAPTDVASTSTAITLDDIFATPLLDYVLYRGYSKDIEVAGNMERAAAHHGNFTGAVTATKGTTAAAAPPGSAKG